MTTITMGDGMNQHPPTVEATIDEQERLVGELESIAVDQRRAVEAEASTDLLRLLGRRADLLERFATVNQRLDALTRERTVREDERPALQGRLDEIRARLARLLDQDAADQRRLHERRDAIEGAVRDLGEARRATRAYGYGHGPSGRTGSVPPRFTDDRG